MLPQLGKKRMAMRVTPSAEKHIRGGHPWLFDGSIESISHSGNAGDLAVIFDRHRRFMAIGLFDPTSPIRVKLLHAGKPVQIDADWFHNKIASALAVRAALQERPTDGYRLINGENDGLPSLIVDRYADYLCVKLYSSMWLPHLRTLLHALIAQTDPTAIVLRLSRNCAIATEGLLRDGQVVYGAMASDTVLFRENGLTFEANIVSGQKTGFFLDQRDNRQLVARYSAEKTVLDLFTSTGGFSVYAARGGATEVTSVDLSAPTLAAAERNMDHNFHLPSVSRCEHTLIADDAFATMGRLHRQGQRFDVVIIDPPSFAQKQSDIEQALHAYSRLTELGVKLVKRGGLLVQASCSSRVSAEKFYDTIERAAKRSGVQLNIKHQTGHAIDHPVTFSEGAYLKCLFATVER